MRWTTLLALALAGCGAPMTSSVPPPTPPPDYFVRYEAGPFYGPHPVYVIVVGTLAPPFFRGEKHTALIGTRTLRLAPDAFHRVSELLAPWRRPGRVRYAPGDPTCPDAPSDMPKINVGWNSGGGSALSDEIDFHTGCADANPELAAALRQVPALLQIEDLIGRR